MDFARLRAGIAVLLSVLLFGCNKTPTADLTEAALTLPQGAVEPEPEVAPQQNAVQDSGVRLASHGVEVAGLDLSWITDDYFAAIIVHPRQILQKQPVAGESRAWVDAAAAELGVTLDELEQVCFLLGPPEHAAESAGPAPLTTAWIFRFAAPQGQSQMMERLLGESRHREVANQGKVYFKAQESPAALCAPDERTVLLATERHMKRAFGPAPRSLLLTRLAAIEGRPDVAGFVDPARLRPLLRRAKAGEQQEHDANVLLASPWARQASESLTRVKEAMLTADLSQRPLARVTLEAEDTQAAVRLEELVQGYRATASLFLPAIEGQWVRGAEGQGFKPLFRLANEALGRIATTRDLRTVTVEMAPPPALANLPDVLESAFLELARGSARQERVRRLQMIGLAMHNHHVARGSFPAAASRDVAGRPLLSWRVHLLPWLGEEDLYHQFRLDQPWDSPHNAALLTRMPALYQTGGTVSGQTRIVAMIGPGTPFSQSSGPALRDFTDGADQTILLVECGPDRAVPWTQPDDVPFDPEDPAAALGAIDSEGFLALFGDGRVEIIRPEISAAELRDLLTHAEPGPRHPTK